jgi:hypothetical protein
MYYYFGELGFFTDVILGELEKYTKENPDMAGKITIYSYTIYCKMIEILFPGFFSFKYQEYLFPYRVGHTFKDSTCDNEKYKEMNRLEELLGDIPKDIMCTVEEAQSATTYKYLGKSISKKLELNNENALQKMSEYPKTIVYFFKHRNRVDTHRNFWHTPDIEEYLNQFINRADTLHVVYMCSDECYYPPFLSARTISYNPQKNIYVCESYEESITFFNKCELFFSNDSGLVEFAKICGVKEVIILPNYQWLPLWPGLSMINPFGTKISWCIKKE